MPHRYFQGEVVEADAREFRQDPLLALQAAGSGAKQINGLGDKANSSILGLDALFGNVSITVSNPPSDAAAETIIRTLQPKL